MFKKIENITYLAALNLKIKNKTFNFMTVL